MKVFATFLLLVAASTATGQTTPTDTTLIDKPMYKGAVLMGTGDGFVNITGAFRLKIPAFTKKYNAQPYLSIGYLYGSKSGESEDDYIEGLVVALEAQRQLWAHSRDFSLITFIGAGLPIVGGDDADVDTRKRTNILFTGGIKAQIYILELEGRLSLINADPLPKTTTFYSLNVGVRSKTLINMPLIAAVEFAVLGAITLLPWLAMAGLGL